MNLYSNRLVRAQKMMQEGEYDYMLIGPTANMNYLSGLMTSPDERLQLLIIPADGAPSALLPEMYIKAAEPVLGSDFTIAGWSDQKDPYKMLAEIVKGKADRIAIDDTLRADHFMGIGRVMPGAFFEPASSLMDKLRIYKDEHEIEMMHRAGQVSDQVMEIIVSKLRPGMAEKEVALMVEIEYKKLADDISFKPIVASGPNAAMPHHSPGDRILEKGDFIIIDSGALIEGYCSDITRTFCLGQASDEMRAVYTAVQKANFEPFQRLNEKNPLSGEAADGIARQVITEAGFGSRFIHRLGHGIGLEVHEAPYLVEGNSEVLKPGMAFTIEPGIYIPGSFGVRIEDTVVMTDNGARQLTSFNRNLIEI
jgi:Xaa-Pro dipeptidase